MMPVDVPWPVLLLVMVIKSVIMLSFVNYATRHLFSTFNRYR